jgi:hypothetical protein
MKPLDSRYFMAEQIWIAMSSMISVFLTSSLCSLKYSSKQPNRERRRGEREEKRGGGRERGKEREEKRGCSVLGPQM